MKKKSILVWIVLMAIIGGIGTMVLTSSVTQKSAHATPLKVVAGENFWGSIVSQIGSTKVAVTSVVSDPNADPHEYESNPDTARKFTTADYVILNGAGYDSWGGKLLSADHSKDRRVLTISDLLGKKEGDNPHFWYNPSYVNRVAAQIEQDLIALDPSDKAYFQQQYVELLKSFSGYQTQITNLAKQYSGTKVGATEDIFVYLADTAHLDLISPMPFMQAVAEGNDPPAGSIVQFQQQLQSGSIKMLVFNGQTVTPLTDSIKKLAKDQHIPVVGITETIQPPTMSFQDWMSSEITTLTQALHP